MKLLTVLFAIMFAVPAWGESAYSNTLIDPRGYPAPWTGLKEGDVYWTGEKLIIWECGPWGNCDWLPTSTHLTRVMRIPGSDGRIHIFKPVVVEQWGLFYKPDRDMKCRNPGYYMYHHYLTESLQECSYTTLGWEHMGVEE